VDVAFIEDTQHDVDRNHRGKDEIRLVGDGFLEGPCRALKRPVNRCRHAEAVHRSVHFANRVAERGTGRQIPIDGVVGVVGVAGVALGVGGKVSTGAGHVRAAGALGP
jgi:hypothetical protein